MAKSLVLCINFHSAPDVRVLASDLAEQEAISRPDLLVVDNSCNDGAEPLVAGTLGLREVRVLRPPKNLGYFGGADYGLTEYLTKEPLPDWIAVSNPDVRIRTRTFFRDLTTFHSGRNVPDVVAPSLRSQLSGRDQNPYLRRKPSRARMHLYKRLFGIKMLARLYESGSLVKMRLLRILNSLASVRGAQKGKPEAIYAPHGSLVLFHRSYFERGGTLRHGTFLFGEEIFVAETARRLGLTIMYDPRLCAEHKQRTPLALLHDSDLAGYARDAAVFVAEEFF